MINFASFFFLLQWHVKSFLAISLIVDSFLYGMKKSQINHGLYVLFGFVHGRTDEEKHFYNDKRITQVKFKYNSDNSNRI